MISTVFKAVRKLIGILVLSIYTPLAKISFYLNGVHFKPGLKVAGILKVRVTRRGIVNIGTHLHINSGEYYNIIGRQQRTTLWVEGELNIGNNVGMSSVALICNHKIEIGNNVTIGGGVCIYDTDFHAIDPILRNSQHDKKLAAKAAVTIKNNVFIGAHSTILKGVTIGENSVVGACSLVSKDIPDNEIWAGNPAKYIKSLPIDDTEL